MGDDAAGALEQKLEGDRCSRTIGVDDLLRLPIDRTVDVRLNGTRLERTSTPSMLS